MWGLRLEGGKGEGEKGWLTLTQRLLRARCLGGRNWRSRTRRWRRGGRLFDWRRGGGCGFRRGRAWLWGRGTGFMVGWVEGVSGGSVVLGRRLLVMRRRVAEI